MLLFSLYQICSILYFRFNFESYKRIQDRKIEEKPIDKNKNNKQIKWGIKCNFKAIERFTAIYAKDQKVVNEFPTIDGRNTV